MKELWIVICVAVICITLIEIVALMQGIDGIYLGSSLAAIGAIVGAVLKHLFDTRKDTVEIEKIKLNHRLGEKKNGN